MHRESPEALDSGKRASATCGPKGTVRAVTMETLLPCLYIRKDNTRSSRGVCV